MLAWGAAGVSPATSGTLTDESPATTLVVRVREQAHLEVPAKVSFDVADPTTRTLSSPVSVRLNGIVLSQPSGLRVLVRADAPAFTPPDGGTATWRAEDVSWSAAPWSDGTGIPGTLSSSSFQAVAHTSPGAARAATSGLVFALSPSQEVRQAGLHTLTVTWKIESMVPQP